MTRPFLSKKRRSGFTMLELVAVIGIIAVMSVVVVSGYVGITRSLGARAGADAIKRTLTYARQLACNDGVDTYVWVTGLDTFVVVRHAGIVTREDSKNSYKPSYLSASKSGNWIIDEFADLSGAAQTFNFAPSEDDLKHYCNPTDSVDPNHDARFLRVFNMDTAKSTIVQYPPYHDANADAWIFGVKDKGVLKAGDAYGWLAMPEQRLPKGFSFDVSYGSPNASGFIEVDMDKTPCVHFYPDGTVETGETFLIRNASASGSANKPAKVVIDGDGAITVTTN